MPVVTLVADLLGTPETSVRRQIGQKERALAENTKMGGKKRAKMTGKAIVCVHDFPFRRTTRQMGGRISGQHPESAGPLSNT
jgi:hypothetical protein